MTIIFRNKQETIREELVANAAPFIPKIGIRRKLKNILNNIIEDMKTVCQPGKFAIDKIF